MKSIILIVASSVIFTLSIYSQPVTCNWYETCYMGLWDSTDSQNKKNVVEFKALEFESMEDYSLEFLWSILENEIELKQYAPESPSIQKVTDKKDLSASTKLFHDDADCYALVKVFDNVIIPFGVENSYGHDNIGINIAPYDSVAYGYSTNEEKYAYWTHMGARFYQYSYPNKTVETSFEAGVVAFKPNPSVQIRSSQFDGGYFALLKFNLDSIHGTMDYDKFNKGLFAFEMRVIDSDDVNSESRAVLCLNSPTYDSWATMFHCGKAFLSQSNAINGYIEGPVYIYKGQKNVTYRILKSDSLVRREWYKNDVLISASDTANISIGIDDTSDYFVLKVIQYFANSKSENYLKAYIKEFELTDDFMLDMTCMETKSVKVNMKYPFAGQIDYQWKTSPNIVKSEANIVEIKLSKPETLNVIAISSEGLSDTLEIELKSTGTSISIPSICYVTSNEQGKNEIVFSKLNTDSLTAKYNMYRESFDISDEYELIGELVPQFYHVFTDTFSNPLKQSYSYRIQSENVCGQKSLLSSLHKTIHLNINQGQGNVWNLNWSEYVGINVSSYRIYRGTSPDNMIFIGSTTQSNRTYSDFSAPANEYVFYQIEVKTAQACNPLKSTEAVYNTIKSNIATNKPVSIASIDEALFSIWPNPAGNVIHIELKDGILNEMSLRIYNVEMKQVMVQEVNANLMSIDISKLASGVYFINIEDRWVKFLKD